MGKEALAGLIDENAAKAFSEAAKKLPKPHNNKTQFLELIGSTCKEQMDKMKAQFGEVPDLDVEIRLIPRNVDNGNTSSAIVK